MRICDLEWREIPNYVKFAYLWEPTEQQCYFVGRYTGSEYKWIIWKAHKLAPRGFGPSFPFVYLNDDLELACWLVKFSPYTGECDGRVVEAPTDNDE